MGRKSNSKVRMTIMRDELPEDWEIVRASSERVAIMPSKLHDANTTKQKRANRRRQRQRDRLDVRDLKEHRYV
jgi:hypothetical protein